MSVNTALIRLIYPQRSLWGAGWALTRLSSRSLLPPGQRWPQQYSLWLPAMVIFWLTVPLGLIALLLAIKFLPPNGARSTMPKFDLPSAVMNALTFGLLITALSGFAQGQSITVVSLEIIALLITGWMFVRRQLRLPVPLLPVDLLRIPLFSLSICTSICSFCAQMLALVSLPFSCKPRSGAVKWKAAYC